MGRKCHKARVLIVDDQPVTCLGLKTLIEQDATFELVGETPSTGEGLLKTQRDRPDLVVLDIAVEGDRGIEFIQSVKDMTKVLVFSLREERLYAERCLRAGARGYVSKREPVQVVQDAMHRVVDGELAVSERLNKRLLHHAIRHPAPIARPHVETLTDRELEVFELLGQGATTREAAETLNISVKTVQGYQANIKRTMSLANNNQLIRRAVYYVLEGQ